MEEGVLLRTKPLVNSICHFIGDLSGIFFRSVQRVLYRSMMSLFLPFPALNELGFLRHLLFRIMAMANRFVLKDLRTKTRKKKTLYDVKVFKEFLNTRKEKLRLLTVWKCKKLSKNLFFLCKRKMVKNTSPCPSKLASSKKQLWVLRT